MPCIPSLIEALVESNAAKYNRLIEEKDEVLPSVTCIMCSGEITSANKCPLVCSAEDPLRFASDEEQKHNADYTFRGISHMIHLSCMKNYINFKNRDVEERGPIACPRGSGICSFSVSAELQEHILRVKVDAEGNME